MAGFATGSLRTSLLSRASDQIKDTQINAADVQKTDVINPNNQTKLLLILLDKK